MTEPIDAAVAKTASILATEIAARVNEVRARTEDWLNDNFRVQTVDRIARDVIAEFLTGRWPLKEGAVTATGWAIIDNGKINVATVSPTRRGAMVNWLVAVRQIMIAKTTPDEVIEQIWCRESTARPTGTVRARLASAPKISMVKIEAMQQ